MAWGDPELIDSLRGQALFADLDDLALAHIANVATPLEVDAGYVLIDAGQEGTGLFILQDGSVTVEIGSRSIECSAGEFIGELSLLVDGLVHTGRVRAAHTPQVPGDQPARLRPAVAGRTSDRDQHVARAGAPAGRDRSDDRRGWLSAPSHVGQNSSPRSHRISAWSGHDRRTRSNQAAA